MHRTAKLTTLNRLIFSRPLGVSLAGICTLTRKEAQILQALEETYSRDRAAVKLNMTRGAVDFHCKNIIKKLNKNTLIAVLQEDRKLKLKEFSFDT